MSHRDTEAQRTDGGFRGTDERREERTAEPEIQNPKSKIKNRKGPQISQISQPTDERKRIEGDG